MKIRQRTFAVFAVLATVGPLACAYQASRCGGSVPVALAVGLLPAAMLAMWLACNRKPDAFPPPGGCECLEPWDGRWATLGYGKVGLFHTFGGSWAADKACPFCHGTGREGAAMPRTRCQSAANQALDAENSASRGLPGK